MRKINQQRKIFNRRNDIVVRASASQSLDLGFTFRGGCGKQAGKFALICDDKQFLLETDIISSREDIPAQNTNIGQYVSALYDDNWYIGIVQHVDKTNEDVFRQLIYPKGPSHYFYWLESGDVCWVPFQHILCAVTQSTFANSLGQNQSCA